MRWFSKTCSININATAIDGAVQVFQVKYKVNMFGRAKLLNENELPGLVAGKFKESLMAAFLSKTDYGVVDTPLGWRLQDKEGKIYQYEFEIERPDGKNGIPYKGHALRETEFLDMRNLLLSKNLDGATIKLFINDKKVEVKGTFEPITRVYRHVRLRSIRGSSSCAYETDAPVKNPEYRQAEHFNYDMQNKWLFRHFLQFQNASFEGKAPRKAEEWFAARATSASGQSAANTAGKNQQDADSGFGLPGGAPSFPAHMVPLSEAPQPYFWQGGFPGAQAAGKLVQGIGSEEENSGTSSGAGKAERFGYQPSGAGRADRTNMQGEENSAGRREGKNSNFKQIPLSSLTNFKAVIFDLDGVVVDSEKAHLRSFNELLAPFGVKITEKMWRENYTGVGSLAILKDVFARNGIKEDVRPWMEKRAEIYHNVIEREGLKEISGFSQFFGVLERNGIKVAVASGGHKPHILASMMSIGMPRVEFVGLEDVKNAKPAPDTFLLAAAKLGVAPSQCVVFEDSLAGIRAAAAAGMPCIALSTTLPAVKIKGKATLIVNNFASPVLRREIKKLIAEKGGRKKEKVPGWFYPVKRRKAVGGKGKPAKKSRGAAPKKKAGSKSNARKKGAKSRRR